MASALIARSLIVVFGLLYPAYNSYKAIKTRDVKGYVKWMIYWIVFALFYNVETITDIVLSWLPLYYELKVIFIIWLLSPQTQGSDVIYMTYVHPHLTKHEQELDKVWDKFKDHSYSALVKVGVQGVNLALQGAIKGQTALAEQLTKSQYSETGEDNTDSVDYIDGEESFEETVIEEFVDAPQPVRGHGGRTLNRSQSLLTHRHDKPQSYQRRHGTDSTIYSSDIGYTLRRSRQSEPTFHAEQSRESGVTRRQISQTLNSVPDRDESQSVRKRYSNPIESPTSSRPVLRFEPEETRAARSRTIKQRKSSDNLLQLTQKSSSTTHKQSTNRGQSVDTSLSKASKSSNSKQSKSSKSRKQRLVESEPLITKEEANLDNKLAEEKPKTTEEKMLYKTKKISDIKHHKIKSPFLTMW